MLPQFAALKPNNIRPISQVVIQPPVKSLPSAVQMPNFGTLREQKRASRLSMLNPMGLLKMPEMAFRRLGMGSLMRSKRVAAFQPIQ